MLRRVLDFVGRNYHVIVVTPFAAAPVLAVLLMLTDVRASAAQPHRVPVAQPEEGVRVYVVAEEALGGLRCAVVVTDIPMRGKAASVSCVRGTL
jgi:hypothetical protein